MKKDIPEVLNSEDYQKQRQAIIQSSREMQNKILSDLDNKIQQQGFTLRKVATGLVLVPIKDGQMLTPEQFDRLPNGEKKRLEQLGQTLQEELNEEFQSVQKLEQETKEKLEQHQRRMMRVAIAQPMKVIRQEFKHLEPAGIR
ncbi:MAG: AAA family ATPase, partial [candidate division KSB1 bacterium]|nr:AAA family ATPase [candidate division KSB1 bacterium]